MRFMRSYILKIISLLAVAVYTVPFCLAENIEDNLSVGIMSSKTVHIKPLEPVERDIVNLYNLVYESLLVVGDNGLPEPYLATDVDLGGGGNTLRFNIRDDVYFSDGRKLTAYDIAACGNYLLNIANSAEDAGNGMYNNMKYNIKSFSADSETNLVVSTNRPYYISLYSLCFPVVPSDMIESENPPGSGPYVIDNFDPGKNLWLKVNDRWWKNRPQVSTILATLYNNSKNLMNDFEFGRLDAVVTRSLAAAQYKSGVGVLSIPYRTNQLEVLLLNNNEYRLKDLDARKAIMKAIDVNQIISRIYSGRASRSCALFPSTSPLYADIESEYSYNLEEAKQLLSRLGWEDSDDDGILDKIDENGEKKNFVLRILTYEEQDSSVRYETANRICTMLEKLKIKARVIQVDMKKAKETLVGGAFDMALVAFRMDEAFDPGFLLMTQNATLGNYGRYKSRDMDNIISNYRTKTDLSDLASAAYEIQIKFTQDLPFIPLFYRVGTVLSRKVYTVARDIREMEVFRGIESFEVSK